MVDQPDRDAPSASPAARSGRRPPHPRSWPRNHPSDAAPPDAAPPDAAPLDAPDAPPSASADAAAAPLAERDPANDDASRDPWDEPRARPRRLSRRTRIMVTQLLLVSAAGSAGYQALILGGLLRTSTLFIGLPVLLGLLVVHLTRARSAYGRVVQANVLFLAVAAPLLGEGSLCLFMAAPLFLGVSMLVTTLALAINSARRDGGRRTLATGAPVLICLLALGLAERNDEWLPAPLITVTSETRVAGDVHAWRDVLLRPVPVVAPDTPLLSLGFPAPFAYERDGDVLAVRFGPAEGVVGDWRVSVTPTRDGVVFRCLDDGSKVGDWLGWVSCEVTAHPDERGWVRLMQRTRYRSRLRPVWYFRPAMDRAWQEVHALARHCWTAALAARAAGAAGAAEVAQVAQVARVAEAARVAGAAGATDAAGAGRVAQVAHAEGATSAELVADAAEAGP